MTTAVSIGTAVDARRWLGWSGVLLAAYLGLCQIYWLPGVPVAAVSAAKLALVGSAVVSVFAVSLTRQTFALPRGLLGPVGFVLFMLCAAPGLFQSDLVSSTEQIKDFVLSFVFLWSFYIFAKQGEEFATVFRVAVVILVGFCFLTLTNAVFGTPSWMSPLSNLPLALHLTGFNAKRTGWSDGLALFFPLILLFLYPRTRRRRDVVAGRVFFLVAAVAIVGSQVVCGGRAGLLASLTTCALLIIVSPARKAIGLLVVVAGAVIFSLSDYLFEQLRLYHLLSAQVSANALDTFSAGRVAGYSVALELIGQRPLVGHGFGQLEMFDYGIQYRDIHNLWLKLAAESGIALPVFFAVLVGAIFYRARRLLFVKEASERALVLSMAAVLVNGLVISLFEPGVLIGAFQNSASWWACAGALVGYAHRRRVQSRNVPT